MHKRQKKRLFVITILVFVIILIGVLTSFIGPFDEFIYRYVLPLRSSVFTALALGFSWIGGGVFLVSFSLLLWIILRNKLIGQYVSINLAVIAILNYLLKVLVSRPRPVDVNLTIETGYSFPSGHAMVNFAYFGLLIYFLWKFAKSKKWKVSLTIFLSFLILFIGVSRIYLGVHYASDVIAGFLLSFAYLLIYTDVLERFVFKKEKALKF